MYVGLTDHLWEKHCQRDFRNAHLEEYESWREMHMRLSEERERKLQRLTKTIVSAHSGKPKGLLFHHVFVLLHIIHRKSLTFKFLDRSKGNPRCLTIQPLDSAHALTSSYATFWTEILHFTNSGLGLKGTEQQLAQLFWSDLSKTTP